MALYDMSNPAKLIADFDENVVSGSVFNTIPVISTAWFSNLCLITNFSSHKITAAAPY